MILLGVLEQSYAEMETVASDHTKLSINLSYFVEMIEPYVLRTGVLEGLEQPLTSKACANKYIALGRALRTMENYTVSRYNCEVNLSKHLRWDNSLQKHQPICLEDLIEAKEKDRKNEKP